MQTLQTSGHHPYINLEGPDCSYDELLELVCCKAYYDANVMLRWNRTNACMHCNSINIITEQKW